MRTSRTSLGFAVGAMITSCIPPVAPRAAPSPVAERAPAAPSGPLLPRGGRTLFPDYELVGFCGTPGAPALGELTGNVAAKANKLVTYADKYVTERKVLPVFELIAVVVQAGAGNDGKYRHRVDDSVVDQYLALARAHQGILLLNIQPGQSDFMTEVKHFERYLREPDVGVALDPEWAMKPKQLPGKFFGQTTGEVINDVGKYLSSLITDGHLPEKALVFHQVNGYVLKDEPMIEPSPGVVVIKSVDGLGPQAAKRLTYTYLMKSLGKDVHPGFKLFFDEDRTNGGTLMKPEEVLSLLPRPEYVMYE